MSEIKVDVVSPYTGTGLQIGESGDTVTVPSGANLKVNNIDVVAVAPSTSGKVLTSDGTNWTSATPAAGGTKEFFIPFLFNSYSSSSPAYAGNNAGVWETTYQSDTKYAVANFLCPNDFTSLTEFVVIAWTPGVSETLDIDVNTAMSTDGENTNSNEDSLSAVTQLLPQYCLKDISISGALTGLAADDYVACKVTCGSSTPVRLLGLRFKYS